MKIKIQGNTVHAGRVHSAGLRNKDNNRRPLSVAARFTSTKLLNLLHKEKDYTRKEAKGARSSAKHIEVGDTFQII